MKNFSDDEKALELAVVAVLLAAAFCLVCLGVAALPYSGSVMSIDNGPDAIAGCHYAVLSIDRLER